MRVDKVPIDFIRVDGPPIWAGLRVDWMDGADSGVQVNLTAGAGCGSPYLTLTVTFSDGRIVYEVVDVSEVVQARVAQVVEEMTS